MPLFEAVVEATVSPAPAYYEMTLRPAGSPGPGPVRPGQFWHIVPCGESLDPLLRRPFSAYDVLEKEELFRILFRVTGRGTRLLAALPPGSDLSVLGPLGNGFTLPPGGKGRVLLVGGGAGAVPLYYLARKLLESGLETLALLGARSGGELVVRPALERLAVETHAATDDGSAGHHGPVTDLLREQLQRSPLTREIFCCGPAAMIETVIGIAREHAVNVQASLEERMACGVGACMGCAFPAPGSPEPGEGKHSYRRVCVEGPVISYRF